MILELCATMASTTDAAGQALRSPRLDSTVEWNSIQKFTDWDWKQENGKSPSQMSDMKEENMNLIISLLNYV